MRSTMKAMMLSGAVVFGLGVSPVSAQHEHGEHEHGQHEHGAHEQGEGAGHAHNRAAAHGGAVTMSKEFHIETVFMPDQVRLYLYDGSQNPVHVKQGGKGMVEATGVVDFRSRGRGTATLTFARGTPAGYACPMHADQTSSKPGKCAKCSMNLAKKDVPEGTLWSCPMHPDEHGQAAGKCGDCGMKYTPQDYLVAMADLSGLKAGDAKVTFDLKNLPGESERTLRFTEKFAPAKMHDDHDGGEQMHGDHGHGDHGHDH